MKRKLLGLLLLLTLSFVLLALFTGVVGKFAPKVDEPRPSDGPNVRVTTDSRWNTSDIFLAVDDRLERVMRVANEDSKPIQRVLLSAEINETNPGQVNLTEALEVTVSEGERVLAGPISLADFSESTLTLAKPLKPGEAVELSIAYQVRLPGKDADALVNELQGSEVTLRFFAQGRA